MALRTDAELKRAQLDRAKLQDDFRAIMQAKWREKFIKKKQRQMQAKRERVLDCKNNLRFTKGQRQTIEAAAKRQIRDIGRDIQSAARAERYWVA